VKFDGDAIQWTDVSGLSKIILID